MEVYIFAFAMKIPAISIAKLNLNEKLSLGFGPQVCFVGTVDNVI